MDWTDGPETRTGQTSQGIGNQDGQSQRVAASLGRPGSTGGADGLFFPVGAGGGDSPGARRAIPGDDLGGIVRQLIADLQAVRSLRLAEVAQLEQRLGDLEQLQQVLLDGQQ
jgi:hypothetical protein